MKIIDIIMKVIKTGFSLLNATLAVIALFMLYKMLIKIFNGSADIMDIILPLYLLLIFSFNTITNWKQFPLPVSIAQIILTLILLPILSLVVTISVPISLNIASQINPDVDYMSTSTELVASLIGYIKYLFYSLSFNIALQAIYERRIKST